MTWHTFPHHTIAEQVCTQRQLDTLRLLHAGASTRDIAIMLGVSRASIREHQKRALQKIHNHPDYQKAGTAA